jgi:DNA (cytosine-5)-methyltransferase 1
MEKQPTFIDLFAGIDGFHFALHNQGAKCVFASEWDEPARETYQKNFSKISPEIFELKVSNGDSFSDGLVSTSLFAGDITKVQPKDVPDHDIVCAGFPCQPFSISGLKKGFFDTRGTLFFDVLQIIKQKQPKVVFLENVKHLIHHDKGNTLKVILGELEKARYKVSWKLLNAKDFGLAQNRERIVIIGNKDKKFDFDKLEKVDTVLLKDILEKDGDFEFLDEKDYTILSKNLWKTQGSGLIFCGYRNKSIRKAGTRPNTEHLSRVHKQPNRIYHIDGTHPTIPSQESSGRFWIYDGKRVRRLTIRECYRLQGFPDDFVLNDRLSACYNQVGNAVAVPMIEAVYKQIKEQLL